MADRSQPTRPIIPGYVPLEYADLLERCWSDSYRDRPSFEEVLAELQRMQALLQQASRERRMEDLEEAGMAPIRMAGGRKGEPVRFI